MKPFMDEEFLLENETARTLYHDYAEQMPIVDYHCHLSPQEICGDKQYDNITQVWLYGDHYKWRLMRANGIDEHLITGDASDIAKFRAFAQTLGLAIGNPVYHWSHLELKRYFGYDGILNEKTADDVFELTKEKLREPQMSARGLIKGSNVRLLCTTDDPADDLHFHQQMKEDASMDFRVLPAWRPDKAVNIDGKDFGAYLTTLGESSGVTIDSFDTWKDALTKRMDFFDARTCSVSDHGLNAVVYEVSTDAEADAVLKKRLQGEEITEKEARIFQTRAMVFLGTEYAKRGWVMQLHFGAKRNNRTGLFERLGADVGGDSIGSAAPLGELADYLDALDVRDALPKTIIYSLNPNDDAAIESIMGCFQDGSVKGKLQHGSGWWFNDNKTGMIAQMTNLANQGLLAHFVGMLTDSRSFLSYTRHEYFRRIFCNLLGTWVENGEFPHDMDALRTIVEGVSYRNAVSYFGFNV